VFLLRYSIRALLTPPAFCERHQRSLARGFVAVRRRAVFSSQESASLKPSSL
jgi:hypothetical protein